MAAGAWTFYNNGKLNIGRGADLSSSAFKVTLHTSTYAPSITANIVYADLSNELATANGYTNGGLAMTSVTWTDTAGTEKFTSAAMVWNATGAGIVARYAVIRAVGTFNTLVDPLVCYCLLDSTPADVTCSAGNTLTITPNASGIFTMT